MQNEKKKKSEKIENAKKKKKEHKKNIMFIYIPLSIPAHNCAEY